VTTKKKKKKNYGVWVGRRGKKKSPEQRLEKWWREGKKFLVPVVKDLQIKDIRSAPYRPPNHSYKQ